MILLGDCLVRLKELPDNSVDSVVTDPPWAIKFMSKRWDYEIPSTAVWLEVLRVLKPGGHALVCCGTRTQHRMVLNVEDAGFDIRDVITHLYGSGFPKSHNVGDGIGTALKPAAEFWTLARKPLSESTVAKNVLKWGTGGLNIDASRIGVSANEPNLRTTPTVDSGATSMFKLGNGPDGKGPETQGRWPANLLLDETAAEMLDHQTGSLHPSGNKSKGLAKNSTGMFNIGEGDFGQSTDYKDSGGGSRFFYCAKASKAERNAGLEGLANGHPTVKPQKLMEYLIKLITPPGGTVLDPFVGSGSTGVAAVKNGFKFIGCEMSAEYVEIAEKRIAHAVTP